MTQYGRQGARRSLIHTAGFRLVSQTATALSYVLLVRGMRPQSVVDDADEAELLRRLPTARVEHVAEAGHSVQGDTPVELAALLADFADAAGA